MSRTDFFVRHHFSIMSGPKIRVRVCIQSVRCGWRQKRVDSRCERSDGERKGRVREWEMFERWHGGV